MRSPAAGWKGGKFRLAKKIIERIPEHQCYVEPFAGAAWILFKKPPEISKTEILNDVNRDLVTMYRVIQNHLEEFIKQFKWVLVSRDEFDRQNKVRPETLTDIQRAARFYYRLKTCFGGSIMNPTFGYCTTRAPKLNLLRIEEELSAVHLRLSGVTVECLPFEDVLKRYDRPATFFYLDPPYFNCENDYGLGIFSKSDFKKLATALARIKGKFLLSLNDLPETRKLFKGFKIDTAETRYSPGKKNVQAREILVSNY